METLNMKITGAEAAVTCGVLTAGMTGVGAVFTFDRAWEGLSRLAVFRAGSCSRTVPLTGDTCPIPWEVLQTPNLQLEVGAYGINEAGSLVIPTVWACAGKIQPGADPSADPALAPESPLWQQAMEGVEALQEAVAALEADTQTLQQAVKTVKTGIPIPETAQLGQTMMVTAVDENDRPTGWDPVHLPIPPSAQVGQTLVVTQVDEYGIPTAWDASDFPTGGAPFPEAPQFDITVEEDTAHLWLDTLDDAPLESLGYTAMYLYAQNVVSEASSSNNLLVGVNSYATNNVQQPRLTVADFLSTTSQKYWAAYADVSAGVALFQTSAVQNAGSSATVSMTASTSEMFAEARGKVIRNLFIKAGSGIPAGTKFKIWLR